MELFIVGGEWFQTDLVINVIGWVHLGKNFSFNLSFVASYNYLLQSISVKLMHQLLCLINGYLFFSFLEQVFDDEKNGNRKKTPESKRSGDEILGFDLVFVG